MTITLLAMGRGAEVSVPLSLIPSVLLSVVTLLGRDDVFFLCEFSASFLSFSWVDPGEEVSPYGGTSGRDSSQFSILKWFSTFSGSDIMFDQFVSARRGVNMHQVLTF